MRMSEVIVICWVLVFELSCLLVEGFSSFAVCCNLWKPPRSQHGKYQARFDKSQVNKMVNVTKSVHRIRYTHRICDLAQLEGH